MHRFRAMSAALLLLLAVGLIGCAPGGVAIEPAVMRCDNGPRALTLRLPDGVTRIGLQIRSGDQNGAIVEDSTTTLEDLAQYRRPDGSYFISSQGGSTWECEQPAGPYLVVVTDAASGAVIATAPFTIAR
jgi:hypothetical protein